MEKVNFEDYLCNKSDAVDNAAYQLLTDLLRQDFSTDGEEILEWDMQIIGEAADCIEELLKELGMKPCRPFYEGDDRTPCYLGKGCSNAKCTLKERKGE